MLTAVIPTLNAAVTLPATISGLRDAADEIIVSDGGSVDGTPDIAQDLGARVVTGAPGRGGQLALGAATARGDWLLFLHADTRFGPGALETLRSHMADPSRQDMAAAFTLRLDDGRVRARLVEAGAALRGRLFALPYGDQGLLISRELYDLIGGYRDLPLMEDVDIIRRLGRKRLRLLPGAVVTSAARYRRDGYLRRVLRNLTCLTLYGCGVSPRKIKAFYER